jgi:hypothetical protein
MARQQCSTACPTLSWNSRVSALAKVAVSRPPLGPQGTTPAHTCGAARAGGRAGGWLGGGWAGRAAGAGGRQEAAGPALQPAPMQQALRQRPASTPAPRPAHLPRHVHHVRRLQALVEGDAQLAGERVHGRQRAAGQHDGARLQGRQA